MQVGLVIKRIFSVMLIAHVLTNSGFAYSQDEAAKNELRGPRKHLATIIFSGLAGAILGLSTLSFYGRPQDHLVNMAVGAAVGVIVGTSYVTYQAATRPREFYQSNTQSNTQPTFDSASNFARLERLEPIAIFRPVNFENLRNQSIASFVLSWRF